MTQTCQNRSISQRPNPGLPSSQHCRNWILDSRTLSCHYANMEKKNIFITYYSHYEEIIISIFHQYKLHSIFILCDMFYNSKIISFSICWIYGIWRSLYINFRLFAQLDVAVSKRQRCLSLDSCRIVSQLCFAPDISHLNMYIRCHKFKRRDIKRPRRGRHTRRGSPFYIVLCTSCMYHQLSISGEKVNLFFLFFCGFLVLRCLSFSQCIRRFSDKIYTETGDGPLLNH